MFPMMVRSLRKAARQLLFAVGLVLLGVPLAPGVGAQDSPVPDRRLVLIDDVDLPGGDIRFVFDTTLGTCEAICLADPDCAGFTYNTRSRACFPKSETGATTPFAGAVSGRVVATPPDVLAQAAAVRQRLDMIPPGEFTAAREQALGLAARFRPGDLPLRELIGAANAVSRGDPASAIRAWGRVVARSDAADHWLAFGFAHEAAARADRRNRFQLERGMRLAALNATLRATDRITRGEAMVLLARAMEMDRRGRQAIPLLRLATQETADPSVEALLARFVERHGFRLIDHRVESDSAMPRICAVFSEDLSPTTDFAPFVQTAASGLAIEAEGQELCLSGLVHGERYGVTFRAGLPSVSGETLAAPATLELYIRDRSPVVRFPGRGYVLPVTGPLALPVETVNAARIELSLRRMSERNLATLLTDEMFGRPLSHWDDARLARTMAETVWTGTADLPVDLNRAVATRLPLAEMLGELSPGIYMLRAALPGADPWDSPGASQWFMVSDLGLASFQGTDGLHVVVRALSDAGPRDGVQVQLVSRGNAVLGTAETDPDGRAHFAAGLLRGSGPAAPALVVAEVPGEDMAFLSLTDPAFDLSDRGVEGREAPGAVDVFLATDRGAYRAGEVIHLTALARDPDARAIAGLPLIARLMRPDGVEYSRSQPRAVAAAGHVFALPLGPEAPRGGWRIEVLSDPGLPPLATRTVLVEDFLPERIDVTVDVPEGALDPEALPPADVEVRYLFGAPGAELRAEASITLRPVRELDGWSGFRFGHHDIDATPLYEGLPGGVTNAEGRLSLALDLPSHDVADGPFEMTLAVQVADGSNRPVERRLTRPLRPSSDLIGLRPLFEGVVGEGEDARFEIVRVDPDGRARAGDLVWTLVRIDRHYQWYSQSGRWFWEPVTTRTRLDTGTLRVADGPARLDLPVDWGRHELRIETADGAPVSASSEFFAGWFAAEGVTDAPDRLEVGLDRAAYAPGDTAEVRIVAREAGMAVVSVLSDRLVDLQMLEVPAGESALSLPVTEAWGAGAYVAVSLLQPMRPEMGRNPARALGIAHAGVDPGDRRLAVTLDTSEESDPRSPLEAVLRVANAEPGQQVWASVALVDQGILNLTGFTPPDPERHYFAQRRLGVALRDLYGRLIDGMAGAMGTVRSGGDFVEGQRPAQPPTEQLVAFFQGPLQLDEDGRLPLSFDMPAFNGTVRLMAVVWSDTAVGSADAEVLVRDPVVVAASLPRFLAPGDTSRMLLELTHVAGPAGEMALEIDLPHGLSLHEVPATIRLAEGGRARLSLPLEAEAIGVHEIGVTLVTPDGRRLSRQLALPVAANDPPAMRMSRTTIEPGDALVIDASVFRGFRPGSGQATVSAGPLAALNIAGLMRQLDAYPYGCVEQVASAALPYLSMGDLAADAGLATPAELQTRIADAIRLALTHQSSGGGFGLWYAGSGDLWLDAYMTDFLSRARAAGHPVPDRAFAMAIDNLRNRVNYAPNLEEGGAPWAYAFYVLAREGAARIGDLRYFADERASAFDTPLAAGHLAAALAAHGDPVRADRLFAQAVRLAVATPRPARWREDYGTPTRDLAGLVALAAEAGSDVVPAERLTARLGDAVSERMAGGRGLSTQEAVWTLRAADALRAGLPASGLEVDGVPAAGAVLRRFDDAAGAPARLRLTNTGSRPTDVTVTAFGQTLEPEPAAGTTLRITRRYFTPDGRETRPERVDVGTRLVAVLEVQVLDGAGGRFMVDDPLPAGFEIDNPNLLSSGDLRGLDWLSPETGAAFTEARQDRFLAAIDRSDGSGFQLAYMVRAVTPGSFHHPAALVEDMYRPTARAQTASGRVHVVE